MKDKMNKKYPAEDAFLTNPIPSTTESTGCALRIIKEDGITKSVSAPAKGTRLPGKSKEKQN